MCADNLSLHPALQELGLVASHVRRLSICLSHETPADCATLACVEELRVDFLEGCSALDVTKFPSARVLKAFLL